MGQHVVGGLLVVSIMSWQTVQIPGIREQRLPQWASPSGQICSNLYGVLSPTGKNISLPQLRIDFRWKRCPSVPKFLHLGDFDKFQVVVGILRSPLPLPPGSTLLEQCFRNQSQSFLNQRGYYIFEYLCVMTLGNFWVILVQTVPEK